MSFRVIRIVLFLVVVGLSVGAVRGAAAAAPTAQSDTKNPPAEPSFLLENRSLRAENDVSFLTGPNAGDPLVIALDYFQTHQAELGLTPTDANTFVITDHYVSGHTGTTHIYLRQQWQGLNVMDTLTSIQVAADGSIINLYTNFVGDLAGRAGSATLTLTAEEAVFAAAAALNLTLTEPLTVQENLQDAANKTIFSSGGISLEPIPAWLVYQPQADGTVRLAWAVEIYEISTLHWWNIRVDAATGAELARHDYVVNENLAEGEHAAAHLPEAAVTTTETENPSETPAQPLLAPDSYRVYAMPVVSPIFTTPLPPADARTLVTNPADALASPFGWHDTNGAAGAEFTTTQGNNAHAYTDTDANNSPDAGSSPSGGASLDFSFTLDLTQAPSTYRPAAVTNLFYWNNIVHDVFYQYGFNEASGNFQQNNYGRGGLGADYVLAEAQDGSGFNNANFATPVDGSRPRMQMYLGNNVTPNVDGDLDNHVIVHEYGHGISNRLTGGPSTTSCLGNTEQMGEGWSDWLGLVITTNASETATTNRPVGNYLFGYATIHQGIRPAPYTTDMAVNGYTYANRADGNISVPHGVGFIWSTMLWDMYWELVHRYGFNPDFYDAWNSGGNNLAIQLVMDGMKLQPCSPGFVDGRNAILQADQVLTGGDNQCMIWRAFARRGLGFSASQGSTNSRTDGSPAYDLPSSCLTAPTPTSQTACNLTTNSVAYNFTVNGGFTAPVTLSATGGPAGVTRNFAPNPVNSVPNPTTLTLGNLLGATPGVYTIPYTATGGTVDTGAVQLTITTSPAAATLSTPVNGAVNVPQTPILTWLAVAGATSYTVEVDDDPAFGSINYTANVAGTSHGVATPLAAATVYYWRVRPQNSCGFGSNSAAFLFVTGTAPTCTLYTSTDVPKLIPPTGTAGTTTSVLTVSGSGTIADVNVRNLAGTHTWINDLSFQLISPATTQVQIMNQSCGSQDNFNLNLDDEAAPGSWPCPPVGGGTYRPSNPLSTFDGQNANGTWTLQVTDSALGDTGQLNSWGLEICTAAPFSADFSDLPSGYGVAWHTGMGALRLGTGWTADTSFTSANDDATDDGITRTSAWLPGQPATLEVVVNGAAAAPWLAGWVDWNNNGVFEDPAENIADQAVTMGTNLVNFTVSGSYVSGAPVQARFRLYASQPPLGPVSGALPTGAAANGEVEDYSYTFSPTAVTLQSLQVGTGWVVPMAVLLAAVFAAATGVWVLRRRAGEQ